jgi:formylglycine-generating enzyme required for sulfatase activity
MMVIPAGSFMMGSPANVAGRDATESPQRQMTLRAPLAVGKFEVTFAEWDACVAAGGCSHRPDDWGRGRGNRPVINVSWDDAQAYVRWLSRRTGRTYRLLTEAEWEYAARAGTVTAYSFGATISPSQVNYLDSNFRRTQPVGSYAANRFGLHDMHGNVWEWVQDCRVTPYPPGSGDASVAVTTGDCPSRVLRGGSWGGAPQVLRAAFRGGNTTGLRHVNGGFRLARTPGG